MSIPFAIFDGGNHHFCDIGMEPLIPSNRSNWVLLPAIGNSQGFILAKQLAILGIVRAFMLMVRVSILHPRYY